MAEFKRMTIEPSTAKRLVRPELSRPVQPGCLTCQIMPFLLFYRPITRNVDCDFLGQTNMVLQPLSNVSPNKTN